MDINNLLRSLTLGDNECSEALEEIKKCLVQAQNDIPTLSVVNSPDFFAVGNSENNAQKTLACDILELCMSNLKVQETNNFLEILENILKHKNPKVQSIGVRQVEKLANKELVQDVNIIMMLIDCLQSKETSVGTPCIGILTTMLSNNNFLDYQNIKSKLELTLNETDDIIRCRSYNVAVGIATKNAFLLEKVDFLLQRALTEFEKKDLLLQLNILELLKELCLEAHGLVYLENKGTIEKLLRKIETIEEDPLAVVLIPGLMKFFGNMAITDPEKIINSYPAMITSLFNCLTSEDYQLLYTGFDTLGHISREPNGKIVLNNIPGDGFVNVLKHIVHSIPNYPSELKTRSVVCLANVFHVDPALVNNQITYVCERWFSKMLPRQNDLNFLIKLCQNPFEDLAEAAFGFLQSLVSHSFGQEAVSKSGGFVEFLLDRSWKHPAEIKQVKYEIIKVLSDSKFFETNVIVQLKKYIREGIYHVESITEVAYESND